MCYVYSGSNIREKMGQRKTKLKNVVAKMALVDYVKLNIASNAPPDALGSRVAN